MTARRRMRLMRRGGKLAVAVLGVLLLVLLTAVPAFAADRWTDITDLEWVQTYKITADEEPAWPKAIQMGLSVLSRM